MDETSFVTDTDYNLITEIHKVVIEYTENEEEVSERKKSLRTNS